MTENYIITDKYKKLNHEHSVSLANNYLSIDDKLVNMDKIITISVNEIDSDTYIGYRPTKGFFFQQYLKIA